MEDGHGHIDAGQGTLRRVEVVNIVFLMDSSNIYMNRALNARLSDGLTLPTN